MGNLLSYGLSIPRFQIENHVLHPRFGKRAGKRTIVFSDEDPITLACEAASKCLANFSKKKPRHEIDAILFATTTPVFRNRYHASFLAELLELPNGILALDFTASPRSGTDALLLANHLLESNRFQKVLVLAAEVFFPPIGEELKPSGREGHAGCALLLGTEEGIAEITDAQSYSSFVAEEFSYRGSAVQLDSRFGREAGFKSNLGQALENFFEGSQRNPGDYKSVILNSLYARSATGLFKKRGFDLEKQLSKDSLMQQTGFAGACHAINLMIQALEKNAGKVLLLDYFNGTNIIELQPTRQVDPHGNTIEQQLGKTMLIESYQDYLTLRKAGNLNSRITAKQEMFSSDMMQEREKKQSIHLKGFECTNCRTIYFIKTQRCKKCNGEAFGLKKLAKHGTIFSFTREHYFPSSFPPVTMAVVDLDGGGRITVQVTDEMYPRESDNTLIGSKVRLVLRKMMENDAKPNYFWKCKLYG
ncbi:MAG: OB-fold domain-containing protein [bacterium]